MLEVLSDERKLETESYKGRRCIFELEGKKINPYHVMECRYDKVLLPLYQKIIGRKKACKAGEVQEKKERGRQHV